MEASDTTSIEHRVCTLDDPVLTQGVVLAETVYHPETAGILLRQGSTLTAETVARLHNFGVATVTIVMPVAAKSTPAPEGAASNREATDAPDEQLQGTFSLKDPRLPFMLLAEPVCHPESGAILFTGGCTLTPTIIFQLRSIGVTTVEALSYASHLVEETVGMVEQYMRAVEEIIRVHGQSARSYAAYSWYMAQLKELQQMMQERMGIVQQYFNEHAAGSLVELENYHARTAHHCVTTSFYAMDIARELQWKKEPIFETAMAALTHDIGKVQVSQDTLEWLGILNDAQWKEIQLHTLVGGRLLQQGSLNSPTMTALNHHEWYADVEGKGYGALTTFREIARNTLKLDIDIYLAHALPRQLEIVQIVSIADMVSALEESYAYREALPPVKVLLIMNNDARLGHFNPEIFKAWHTLYVRKHRKLLYKGVRISPPCEKDRLVVRDKDLFIGLDVVVRHLSYEDLAQLDLLRRLKSGQFDPDVIKKHGKISMDRLRLAGIEVNPRRLASLGIQPERQAKMLLPMMETRLTRDELLRAGISAAVLDAQRVGVRPQHLNNGLSLAELDKMGIRLSKEQLAAGGKSIKKKICYEMLVVEELDDTRALFAIVREGDDLEALEHANMRGTLDPLRNYLLNKIGLVEMDLRDRLALPDLSHVV
ncbi:MAG: HD domain-containing protein, partial [Magnetococcales bacterium]|nr:HD domain-containing protein [Magnetococcales bacterium]